jgi:glycosyltransferase involved in cell wall biosynthesis
MDRLCPRATPLWPLRPTRTVVVKAVYATTYNSADPRAWSGLGYHISACLELAGLSIKRIGPLARRVPLRVRSHQLMAKLAGRSYALDRDPEVARRYSAELERQAASVEHDLVFSPGTIPIAYLGDERPAAFWADATFGGMLEFYEEYVRGDASLSRRAIRNGTQLDTRALDRAAVALYASDWAARSAIEYHGADPERVKVVPFGANMPVEHGRDEVVRFVASRPLDRCRLLFVGLDWARKGADRALEVARALNDQGLPTELHVVGSSPAESDSSPWLHCHGFVDKSTEEGWKLLRALYSSAHFLIHPARAECFGVVFSEAAAHGVVSLATRVGGIPTAVRHGETGALFDVSASPDEYVECIFRLLADDGGYEQMALAAFDDYQRRLSWEAAAKAVREHLGRVA